MPFNNTNILITGCKPTRMKEAEEEREEEYSREQQNFRRAETLRVVFSIHWYNDRIVQLSFFRLTIR